MTDNSSSHLHFPILAFVSRGALTREMVLLALFILEMVVFSFLSPYFFTASNLFDITSRVVETGLVALGVTLVIITGGIDLSVGSALALVSVTVGFTFAAGVPLPLAILLGLLVGVLGGAFNGVLIARFGLPPFAVTLGTFAAFRGLAYAVSNAGAVSSFPDWFASLGQSYVWNLIPAQIVVFLAAYIALWLYSSRTRFGTYLCATGTNEQTTRFSGVSVVTTKIAAYTLTGLLVALASVIYTSRVSTARGNAGLGLELTVIAAVVLGGASITGGSGTILGTTLGVLILTYLQAGLTLAGVEGDWSLIVTGLVLIIGVFFNEFFRRSED
jgi:rhamnose transport system permease protein